MKVNKDPLKGWKSLNTYTPGGITDVIMMNPGKDDDGDYHVNDAAALIALQQKRVPDCRLCTKWKALSFSDPACQRCIEAEDAAEAEQLASQRCLFPILL